VLQFAIGVSSTRTNNEFETY